MQSSENLSQVVGGYLHSKSGVSRMGLISWQHIQAQTRFEELVQRWATSKQKRQSKAACIRQMETSVHWEPHCALTICWAQLMWIRPHGVMKGAAKHANAWISCKWASGEVVIAVVTSVTVVTSVNTYVIHRCICDKLLPEPKKAKNSAEPNWLSRHWWLQLALLECDYAHY